MYIYLNGNIVSEEQATISPFDHGFMYGLGVFETFRIYNGHPFLLDDHFLRLQNSLEQLGIAWDYSKQDVLTILQDLLNVNGLQNAYVRWNVSAGPSILGLHTEKYTQPTTTVYMKSILDNMATVKKGQVLNIRRNTPEGQNRLKSHHYLNSILGKREIGDATDVEGIFLTKEGFLAEGIVSNLFWLKENKVYTPSLDTGILDGITRRFVLAILEKNGFRCIVGEFPVENLLEADEAFVTNSIQEVISLSHINEKKLPTKENSIGNMLQMEYREYREKLWSKGEIMV
ncbi:aminodeoxychorismate lyase [Bacillus sp. FJAT-45350]|uniref:aminodeoxychorismate lyase n=1 Tax=Bacillus sp. FJAT-45350 TaxID=2011014 RepID=UPI000BB6D783|nr:aminodeoxychorismate lyase [Bacillus sp. FJAT-45350]